MHIAMIGQKGYPAHYGGVERHVAEISGRLVRAGHDVTVYNRAWYGGHVNTTGTTGVRVKTLPTLQTKHLDAIFHTFVATLHAIYAGADVIHYHGVGPSLLSWIPRVFSRATVITTFHCIDRHHQKWNWMARLFLRMGEWAACTFAHDTITVSHVLEQYCRNEFRKDTTYIPNGVTLPSLTTPPHRDTLTRFGLSEGKYILMVSRLVPHKGAHVLIEAFQRLKHDHQLRADIADMKLAIVGGSAYTDEYIRSLHEQAAASNDIVFTDYQSGDTLDALFRGAAFAVHPSMNEGLPITVLEAMSYAKPIIVSNIPEHIEVIKNPQMIFIENDATSLYDRMDALLQMSDAEKADIGSHNTSVVARDYDWETIAKETIALYERQVHGNERAHKHLSTHPVA